MTMISTPATFVNSAAFAPPSDFAENRPQSLTGGLHGWPWLLKQEPALADLAARIERLTTINSAWGFWRAWRSIRAELRYVVGERARKPHLRRDEYYELSHDILLERLELRWRKNGKLAEPTPLPDLLAEARTVKFSTWHSYTRFNRRLQELELDDEDHDAAHRQLMDALRM